MAAETGLFSDENFVSIGNFTNADYVITGTVLALGNPPRYTLSFNVVNARTGAVRAGFSSVPVSLSEITDQQAIRLATAELLGELGVTLSVQGRSELLSAANNAEIQTQRALANANTAERQGSRVQALSHIVRANAYDPTLAEAAARLSVTTANITSGNFGADVRRQQAEYDEWRNLLLETEALFRSSVDEGQQPFYLVYSPDFHQSNINFAARTVDLIFNVGVYPDIVWLNQINSVMSAVNRGLRATGAGRS